MKLLLKVSIYIQHNKDLKTIRSKEEREGKDGSTLIGTKHSIIIGRKNKGNVHNDHSSLLSSISIDTFLDGETLEKIMDSYMDNHTCSYTVEISILIMNSLI